MVVSKKTDNHNPKAKLELRRYFLDKYHVDALPSVLDCCQASGLLWAQLKKEYEPQSYWGVDIKPKKGRLKIDSVRILQQSGWTQDVIDIDTYGEPWKHWCALLPNLTRPTTVFLTIATIKMAGGGVISNELKQAIGLDKLPSIPQTFCGRLANYGVNIMLSRATQFATIVEAAEALSTGNARYIGVHLIPNKIGQRVQPLADNTLKL